MTAKLEIVWGSGSPNAWRVLLGAELTHISYEAARPLKPAESGARSRSSRVTCSDLITSVALLDNRTLFLIEFIENIRGVLLALSKNMLEHRRVLTFHKIERPVASAV